MTVVVQSPTETLTAAEASAARHPCSNTNVQIWQKCYVSSSNEY